MYLYKIAELHLQRMTYELQDDDYGDYSNYVKSGDTYADYSSVGAQSDVDNEGEGLSEAD